MSAPTKLEDVRMRKSFTLIELLVVVAIIAVLVSILLPALSRARFEVRVTQCLSNMNQIAVGLFAYENDYNDKLPTKYWTGSGWESIVYISTWQISTERAWYGAYAAGKNAVIDRFLKLFTPIPDAADVPGAGNSAYICNPKVYYCPGIQGLSRKYVQYPASWNKTVIPELGRANPCWAYFQMYRFAGPDGYQKYRWHSHPFAKGSYPLFCDPVYYQQQTGKPKEGNCNHFDPNRPPQNVVFSDGHAETLYPGDADYYIITVTW